MNAVVLVTGPACAYAELTLPRMARAGLSVEVDTCEKTAWHERKAQLWADGVGLVLDADVVVTARHRVPWEQLRALQGLWCPRACYAAQRPHSALVWSSQSFTRKLVEHRAPYWDECELAEYQWRPLPGDWMLQHWGQCGPNTSAHMVHLLGPNKLARIKAALAATE